MTQMIFPFRRLAVLSLICCGLLLSSAIPAQLQSESEDTTQPAPIDTFADPAEGCQLPPDDYTRVEIRGHVISARTLAMLAHAQTLYGGPIDLTSRAITQGSYNQGVTLSFGTHDAGGAVDLSVRNLPVDWSIRWDDIEPLVRALRAAGFAAWYRDGADGMVPHIHAIAIGDAEASRAAALQVNGRYGYLRGYNGIPQPDGIPLADRHDGPILCPWMAELGFADTSDITRTYELPYELAVGEALQINTQWENELNLRAEPTIRAEVVTRMPPETRVTLMDGPRRADGYRWWLIRTEAGDLGWAVDAVDGALTLVPAFEQ